MRTVFWEDNKLKMIDQRRLPASLDVVSYSRHAQVAEAIRDMVVRGAPAIGAAAAFGLALAARESRGSGRDDLLSDLDSAVTVLKAARPTAVNLAWALDRVMAAARAGQSGGDDLRHLVLAEAQRLADEDVEINKRIAVVWRGADPKRRHRNPPLQHRLARRRGLGDCPRRHSHGARAGEAGARTG